MKTSRSGIGPPESTVERILAAATQVFAELGFGGARVDEIARRANVNKAAIYYHIGGKEALYAEVLRGIFGTFIENLSQAVETADTPEEKLRGYIRVLSQNIREQPHLPAIMMREFASGAQHLPESVAREALQIVEIVAQILREGQERGIFIETSPLLVHTMIVGANILVRTADAIVATHRDIMPVTFGTIHEEFQYPLTQEIERLVLRMLKQGRSQEDISHG